MKNPKFQVFQGKDSQWYFRLRAANGEIICGGEGYTSKQMCLKGIYAVKSVAPNAPVEDMSKD